MIAGGRNPDLRDRDTLTTLDKLATDRWIDEAARDDMKAAYGFLRTVEHRLQMINDEQTQTLPAERDGLERFARFLGLAGRDVFAETLVGHLENVQRHYAKLFETAPGADRPALAFPADGDDRKTLDRLGELGFRAPLQASATVRHWLAGGHRSLKSEVAREHLRELLPVLLEQIARSDNPDAALVRFDDFIGNLHGAARLAVAVAANPDAHRADRAGARHCAATCRHVGALSAGDGRAGRSELLRRLARRGRARRPARSGAGAGALRRGPARAHPHVRARIHVPRSACASSPAR